MKRMLLLTALFSAASMLQAGTQFSTAETTEIQTIVHDYLLAHPEILVQMSQELQQQQYQQMQTQAVNAIKSNSKTLFNPNQTAIEGNPNGTVTLVEFFDYQCVHCANVQKDGVVQNLIKANPNLRVVYKEFPIFGDPSNYAAKAAMAANKQGKYIAMRDGIYATGKIEGALTPADVDAVAKQIGLNMTQYKKDMQSKAFQSSIDESYKLAQALGIQGTPSFVVAPTPNTGDKTGQITFIPGVVSQSALQQAIDAAK